MKENFLRILSSSWKVAWAITLITLPVTSFPLLSRAAGGTLVAPLAIIPLSWLCLTCLPFYLFSRKQLPAETKPLVFFVIAALVSSAAAFFLEIPPFKGHTVIRNNLEAFVTLGIGLAFYFTTLILIRSIDDLKTTLVFINLGGLILLLWSVVQIVAAWLVEGGFPTWMVAIQSFISITEIQGVASRFRVPGTTLEPSWLAHCLNILYISIWLAASSARFSTFRFRILKLTMENLLLVVGIGVLIFTYSRIGLLAFGLVLIWFVLQGTRSLAAKIASRFYASKPRAEKFLQIVLALFFLAILIAGMSGLVYRLSLDDPRFAQLFKTNTPSYAKGINILALANQLDFAERVVSWKLGWTVFENHPLLGVGLGNTGMFALDNISYYAWKLPEMVRVLVYDSDLPNTKNIWTRILAETGLVGFSFFISWLIVLWAAARRLQKNAGSIFHSLGLAGQFTLVALLLEGFSIDTFALPYLWIALGLVTAASYLGRLQTSSEIIKEPS